MYSEKQTGSFLLPSLLARVEAAGENPAIRLPGWNNTRDFSSADRHARAVLHLALQSTLSTVNVGTGVGKTILEFAREWSEFTLSNPLVDMANPPSSIVADIGKLRRLGFD